MERDQPRGWVEKNPSIKRKKCLQAPQPVGWRPAPWSEAAWGSFCALLSIDLNNSIIPLFHGAQKKTLFKFRKKQQTTTTLERGRQEAVCSPLSLSPRFANKPKLPDFPTAAPSLPSSHMAQVPSLLCSPGILPAPTSSGIPGAPEQDQEWGGMLQFDCWWICSIML